MQTIFGKMNGDEWEELCQKILRQKYNDYHEVPAKFGGDLGIEGYTKSGIVFQCYAPDDDLAGIDLYEHQRDKVTKDIRKLKVNVAKICSLGLKEIKEWYFLTPKYNNKDLLSHLSKKESEILKLKIAKVSPGFRILIKTENDYLPEINTLLNCTGNTIQLVADQPAKQDLDRFLNSKNDFISNINRKLSKLGLDPDQKSTLLKNLSGSYIMGQVELQRLNERFPSIHREVLHLKGAAETQLPILTLSGSGDGKLLFTILKDYEKKLQDDFSKNLGTSLIMTLSMEAISDWLGRCSLHFP